MTTPRDELVQELAYVTGKERAEQLADAFAHQLAEVASDTYKHAKKRVTDVIEADPPSDVAGPGEWQNGWDAAMDAVRNTLENKEPTT
ncbi:hypothetical protein [Streptomyces sp. NPDC088254]|uniref:hypothetical protein n=1 Tax=Streptomyces sp. NPDC088254 TaxID=3365847 RepID=UPI00382FF6D0